MVLALGNLIDIQVTLVSPREGAERAAGQRHFADRRADTSASQRSHLVSMQEACRPAGFFKGGSLL
jgi:hypothetical protein